MPEFILPLMCPQNLPDLNPVDYSVQECTKHASLILTTSDIASESEPRGLSWILPSLLQLCVSSVIIFLLVSGRIMVILSTAFNSYIVFLR